ncbi:MAG: hypothetical protein K1X89_28025 [Myxococcaceae bacterium]|nr:hypothetical protein [Myxococcaceae bacterium]
MGFLGGIVRGIESAFVTSLKMSLMLGVGAMTGGVGLLGAESMLAGILGTGFTAGGAGGLLSSMLPMALSNPMMALAPQMGLSNFVGGSVMNAVQSRILGGTGIQIPGMADRVSQMATTTHSYADQIATGGLGNTIAETWGGGTKNIGDVAGTNMSNDERAMLAEMDPKDRNRYILQKRMQEKAEIASLLSNLQKMRHDAAMAIISNMR